MQAGMDEGARMDQGGGRQHAEMLGAAGILHRPEEEALSPQVCGDWRSNAAGVVIITSLFLYLRFLMLSVG